MATLSTGSDDSMVNSTGAEKSPVVGNTMGVVHTNERVPGHPNYYEKDGLRTYGDDEDHDHEPPVSASTEHQEIS